MKMFGFFLYNDIADTFKIRYFDKGKYLIC